MPDRVRGGHPSGWYRQCGDMAQRAMPGSSPTATPRSTSSRTRQARSSSEAWPENATASSSGHRQEASSEATWRSRFRSASSDEETRRKASVTFSGPDVVASSRSGWLKTLRYCHSGSARPYARESHAQVGGERRVSSRHPLVRHRAHPGDVLQLGQPCHDLLDPLGHGPSVRTRRPRFIR